MKTMPASLERPDSELVALARGGDQAAFGQLVSRHQTLVASLAYSICGDFARSQDVAQEAFVTAWRQLGALEEPAKFKAWLSGITRNLGHNSIRQQARRVDASTDAAPEHTDHRPDPREQAVTREESAIVWRALEQLPETYREPLILFYREQQSIERVAAALDLNEDTVRQRLSRGRRMLRAQVESVVARSLGATTPGITFNAAVLAALPVATTQIAAMTLAGTAAKGGAASKAGGVLSWLAGLLSAALTIPLVALAGTAIQSRILARYSRSAEERRFLQRLTWRMGIISTFVLAAMTGLGWWQFREGHPSLRSDVFSIVLLGLLGVGLIGPAAILIQNGPRYLEYVRSFDLPADARQWRRKITLLPRRALAFRSKLALLGLPLVDIRFGHSSEQPLVRGTATGWIAIGDVAHGVVFALGGFAVGGIAIGAIAIGAISCGYLALGLVALGGIAIGGLAKGVVVAIGYIALGSLAFGWEAASGPFAAAPQVARGALSFGARELPPGWEEANPIVRIFNLNGTLPMIFLAVVNAVLAGVGTNALARQRNNASSPDSAAPASVNRFGLKPRFLALLALAVVGFAWLLNLAIDRTARQIAGEIEVTREIARQTEIHYERGSGYVRSGNPAEALAEFLAGLDESMRPDRGIQDDTARFCRSLAELGQTYPPAIAALRERRDRAESVVQLARNKTDGVWKIWVLITLDIYLGELDRLHTFYDGLPASHPLHDSFVRQTSGIMPDRRPR